MWWSTPWIPNAHTLSGIYYWGNLLHLSCWSFYCPIPQCAAWTWSNMVHSTTQDWLGQRFPNSQCLWHPSFMVAFPAAPGTAILGHASSHAIQDGGTLWEPGRRGCWGTLWVDHSAFRHHGTRFGNHWARPLLKREFYFAFWSFHKPTADFSLSYIGIQSHLNCKNVTGGTRSLCSLSQESTVIRVKQLPFLVHIQEGHFSVAIPSGLSSENKSNCRGWEWQNPSGI